MFCPDVVAAVKALVSLDPDFAKTPAQRAEKERAFLEAFPFDPALMDGFTANGPAACRCSSAPAAFCGPSRWR